MWRRVLGSWLFVLLVAGPVGTARAQLVGRIDGEFAVGARGAATYSLPIAVPPGTAGAQPALALVYDSQAGSGPFGVGFGLSGLSSIARCPRDLARDGERRAVAFDLRDALCLDGERLVLVGGVHGAAGAEYRTERDRFARVRALGDGLAAFEVDARDGSRRFYGTTLDSRIEAQGRTEARIWALARVEDAAGNAVRFSYLEDADAGEFVLLRVDYTENARAGLVAYASLRVVLEPRPDPERGFAAGSRVASTRRVAALETYLGEERVREYRLAYEQSPAGRSRLVSVTLCAGSGECLPQTRFVWEEARDGFARAGAWDLPRQLWRDARQEGELADVDGDGRLDLVHGGSATQGRETWLNTGAGFAAAAAWRVPDDLFGEEGGKPHALLVDVNGDALPDYVRAYRRTSGAQEIATHLNRGDGFAAAADAAFAMPSVLFDYADGRSRQLAQLVDLNGDGLVDWVQAYERTGGGEVRDSRLNTGAGFAPADPAWALPARLWSYEADEQRAEAALVDLNGDGLPDLLRACATPASGEQREVWLNSGRGFSGPVAAWRPPRVLWNYAEGPLLRQEGELADVNGDALPDLVIAYAGTNGALRAETWLNTGAGWVRDPAWDLPAHLWTYEGDKHRQTAQLVDANGDGLPDLVQAFETSAGSNRLATWLNNGQGFPDAPGASPAHTSPREVWSYYQNAPRTKSTFADVDGDGAVDFVRAYRASATSLETHLGGARADRVVAIRDGLGGAIDLEYATLADPAVHVSGARPAYPEQAVRDARAVVRRAGVGASEDELRWTTHRYGDLRAHRLLGVELGFAWSEVLDEASGVASATFRRLDWPLHGLVEREETRADTPTGAVLVARTTHDLAAVPGPAPGVFAVQARASREERFELDGGRVSDVRTTRALDAFGNVVREDVDLGDGVSRRTETRYRNDLARWQLGLAERIDVTESAPNAPDQRRSVAQSWDEAGRLATRTVEPDAPSLSATTELARDAFGNEVARTLRGASFETRASAIVYDPRGRFAQLEIDAAGHAAITARDARTGAPLSQLGPDPTVPPTTFGYDALGRLVATTRPDGVTTAITRSRCAGDCPVGAAVAVRSSAPGAPALTVYVDALGRERRRETDGFDGRVARVDLELDARGLVRAETRPYFAGDGAYATRFERDALGRPTRALAPDGSETRWSYAARELRETDALGRTRLERYDGRGQRIESIDALGAATRFDRDASGNLLRIRDAAGNETRFAYDGSGRRVARVDPDLGETTFEYDALGQLVAQRDARGTVTRLRYDALGRLVRREGDGPTAFWTWDRAEHGVGKLARVATSDGAYAREESYDPYGRERATSTRLGRDVFELSRTYDRFGRLATLRYPTGFTLEHAYTGSGHLAAVRGADGVEYWRAELRAADGRVERERLGNGVVTDRVFDPRTGRLDELATASGGATLQALHHAWDARGNLVGRDDALTGERQAFDYDALDRLARASSSIAGTASYAYDAIGNLTYKTGVGVIRHPAPGEPRPHAPLLVGDDPRALAYDAAGNLVSDPSGLALAWSPRSQPLAIARSGADEGFELLGYTPEGALSSRLEIDPRHPETARFTLQLGDLFEQSTSLASGRVERRHAIYVEGALVAVRVAGPGAPEMRYVHRDHLESVVAVSDAAGQPIERVSYDPFGARSAPPGVAPRGYTGHLELERARLVHMRGRIYDPRLGRFLSPDPIGATAEDPSSLNRYAYVANNPLRRVDPTGYFAAAAPSAGPPPSSFGAMSVLRAGVAAAGSFLSDAWGDVRFAATALWNGLGWIGAQLVDGARFLGGAALAGAMWAWRAYDSVHAGVLPDSQTPFGLLESLARGITQPDDDGALYYVGIGPDGRPLAPERVEVEFEAGNLFVNGQCLTVTEAAEKGARLFGGEPFHLMYAPTVNLISDTFESLILKLRPSRLSEQLARILEHATGPVNLVGYSQGALQVYWALTLASVPLPHVTTSLYGAAISSLTHRISARSSGATEGPYEAHWNDLVPNLVGGNFTGGWLLPVLLPVRTIGSILFAPTLFSARYSVHGSYQR